MSALAKAGPGGAKSRPAPVNRHSTQAEMKEEGAEPTSSSVDEVTKSLESSSVGENSGSSPAELLTSAEAISGLNSLETIFNKTGIAVMQHKYRKSMFGSIGV